MAKVIFVGNYKGGVGKTTTVVNLANHMTNDGKRILTLDLDPQSSLSEIQTFNHLGKKLNTLPNSETLNYVFDLSIIAIDRYPGLPLQFPANIIHRGNGHYDFIPSSLFYRDNIGLDTLAIKMKNNIQYLSILKKYIDSVESKYDYIIIDCPPSSNLITQSAFLLSDYYLIPTILDGLSTNGVMHYMDTIERTYMEHCANSEDAIIARHFFGDMPKLIGIFYNMIRGQVSYISDDADFRREMDERTARERKVNPDAARIHIFEDKVNNFIDIARSTQLGKPSSMRDDFETLFKEIKARIVAIGG